MADKPSFGQLVVQAVSGADRPLTLAEIQARVEMVRPVDTRNPKATLRTATFNSPFIASLGGRPAHYTWWPRHLAGCSFRQPLADSDLESGTLALNEETRSALWPGFRGGADRVGDRWAEDRRLSLLGLGADREALRGGGVATATRATDSAKVAVRADRIG